MKIIAWNVNGLRSLMKTDYLDELIDNQKPDILCIGETKLSCPYNDIIDIIKTKYPKYRYLYWSPCKTRGGYSGTAIFCKKEPLDIIYGLKYKNEDIDNEGRLITLEYDKFYLVHVYTPNSGQALNRLEWRVTVWDRAFEHYLDKLQEKKPIIVCGDLNVAHNEIDLKNPKTNQKTAGFTIEERKSFNKILDKLELIDSYRYLYPEKIEYSFWSYMRKAREKNIGWRIDYFLLSHKLKNKLKESSILTNIYGSDHAPVKLHLKK